MTNYEGRSKDPRNTQQQVIDYLLTNPCKT